MCGIFSIFLNRPLDEHDIELGRAGTLALSHRGPDGQGEWMDREAGVYFGHRRLAIIDPSPASDQPMTRDGLVLSLNGEIYNYRDLRQRLMALGEQFRSSGDTEVLLKAWKRYGIRALDMLDGMYGFCLWDGKTGCLAVDRFGEKQIYVAETKDGVYVSSELTPLVRLLRPSFDISAERLTPFMALGYIPAPNTIYPSIDRLLPATTVSVTNGQLGRSVPYWSPPRAIQGRGRPRALSEAELDSLCEILVKSVEGRLESDVPLCLYLSSGVDSALVAAIASRELGRSLPCITVSFPHGNTSDEAPRAGAIASYLGLEHRRVESTDAPEDINPALLLELLGQPTGNLTVSSIFQMSSAAKSTNFPVGLTGVGGDELALGYKKYAFAYKHRRKYQIPSWMHNVLGGILKPWEAWSTKIEAYRNIFGVRKHERALVIKSGPVISILRELPDFDNWSRTLFDSGQPLELAMPEFDLVDTLVNTQLPAFDTGSMRAGHELRTPYINHNLFEAMASFDPRALLAFGQKSVLRRILYRYVPKELMELPKQGFRFPADRFLRHYGDEIPQAAGLSPHFASRVWLNRHRSSWEHLAVRVVMWREFEQWNRALQ